MEAMHKPPLKPITNAKVTSETGNDLTEIGAAIKKKLSVNFLHLKVLIMAKNLNTL